MSNNTNTYHYDKIAEAIEYLDEHWKMEYKYDSKLSFFLCFIVDPMFEKPRKKGQGIYEIKACTEFPKNWNDNDCTIAAISMTKRKFEFKL